jgi:hypothetical protein
MEWMRSSPDVSHAAKEGQPTMTDPKRTIPASVPVVNTEAASNEGAPGGAGGTTDVSATPVGSSSALDKGTDARSSGGTAQKTDTAAGPLPTNRDAELKKYQQKQAKKQAKLDKKKKKTQEQEPASDTESKPNQSQATQGAQTPAGTPNATSAAPNSPQQR